MGGRYRADLSGDLDPHAVGDIFTRPKRQPRGAIVTFSTRTRSARFLAPVSEGIPGAVIMAHTPRRARGRRRVTRCSVMGDSTPQIRRLTTPSDLRRRLNELGCELPVADRVDPLGPLAAPRSVGGSELHNRFAILPMEGWDGTDDGRPTDLVRRRWDRFGRSGAALIWGGEAVAVRHDGRANPRQLCIGAHSIDDLGELRDLVAASHRSATAGKDPVVGLQLTHSGRWSRPDGSAAPRIAYRHPLLDDRVEATDTSLLTDTELDDLVGDFASAAAVAHEAGFDFVDVKHCHGYLLHELLTGYDRPGSYGGSFENRTRFLRRAVAAIRSAAPGLGIAVRLSSFDVMPHVAGDDGVGMPASTEPYPWAFGADGSGLDIDLDETHRFCRLLVELGIEMVCVTAGSPYWCPHVQRPAYFPPSDGYLPPHDPLVDVACMQAVTREITRAHPELTVVGSGLTYLQDWFAHVAQELVRDDEWMHCVGLGRMVLSHPELPARTLAGEPPERRLICRTFSDCTTAPRAGLVSGCWPLDEAYKSRPDRVELTLAKRAAAQRRPAGTRRRAMPEDE